MPWKIGENIIAGQVSATPKQDPGVSRYTKPMPRNGLESINSGASSCRYKYPRELRITISSVENNSLDMETIRLYRCNKGL